MSTSRKKKISQINNLNLYLKELEKEEPTKLKVSSRKDVTKIRVEIDEMETKKTIENINETKSWLFEKINKIDKSLARLSHPCQKKEGEDSNQ